MGKFFLESVFRNKTDDSFNFLSLLKDDKRRIAITLNSMAVLGFSSLLSFKNFIFSPSLAESDSITGAVIWNVLESFDRAKI